MRIGLVRLARENEAGGSWGKEIHILHVNIYDFILFVVVIIELFPNSVFQILLSEGLLQAEAMKHFAGDNDHGNHEF